MKYINSEEFNIEEPCAVSLGKFDGLHAGHMTLIETITKSGLVSVVFSFDFSIFKIGGEKKKILFTDNEKIEAFRSAGVDWLIEYPFTDRLRSMTPREFILMLRKKINVKLVAAGEDFRFGHNREGDTDTLISLGKEFGYETRIISHLKQDGERISSTRIRKCIEDGDVAGAGVLLGHPYAVSGMVGHGKNIGTGLGFPTANIFPDEQKILPAYGVYAVDVFVDGEDGALRGICNVGTRPTVGETDRPDVEVFILDFNGDIYGKQIKINFRQFIRPEMKFGSLSELKAQVEKDVSKVS